MRTKDLAFIEEASSDTHPLDKTHGELALEGYLDRMARMLNRRSRLATEGLVAQHDIQDLEAQFGFKMSERYPLATYTQLPTPTNLRPTLEELSESLGQAASKLEHHLIVALQDVLSFHQEVAQEAVDGHEKMFKVHVIFRERYRELTAAGGSPQDTEDYATHYNEIYDDLLGEERLAKMVAGITPILIGCYALIADAFKGRLTSEELDQRFMALQEALQLVVGGEMRSMRELAFSLCSQIDSASVPYPGLARKSCSEACEILTKVPRASICPILTVSSDTLSATVIAAQNGAASLPLTIRPGEPSSVFYRLKDLTEILRFLFGAQWLYTKQCWNLYKHLLQSLSTQ